jgi:lysyl-tRNA synthetase class 1
MARIAIDAYIDSVPETIQTELYNRFEAAVRALDLACLIRDKDRIDVARRAVMSLHRHAIKFRHPHWSIAFDRLVEDKNAGLTQDEREELVSGLEELVLHFGDKSDPLKFNPHALQGAAKSLIRHYTRLRRQNDAVRLHTAIAQAFEHFASLGKPILASSVLQTAVNAYREAGLKDESTRVRILMEQKIGQSHDDVASVGTEIKISYEDMEKFIESVVVNDLASTLVRIGAELLPRRRDLEQQIRKIAGGAPLMADIPVAIMAEDHVAARIGLVADDLFGRLIHQTKINFGLNGIWRHVALSRAIEKHEMLAEHFVGEPPRALRRYDVSARGGESVVRWRSPQSGTCADPAGGSWIAWYGRQARQAGHKASSNGRGDWRRHWHG